MKARSVAVAGAFASALLLASCRSAESKAPPPEARRPELRSRAEIAAERAQRIAAGTIVAAQPVTLSAERSAAVPRRPAPLITPPPHAVQGDILLVNDAVLTVAEVLYLLRDAISEKARTQTLDGFREQVERLIRRQTQQEIGSLLLYAKAMSGLVEQQVEALERVAREEFDRVVAVDFGGSAARLEKHLEAYGLTLEQFRQGVKRQVVVRQYAREVLKPRIHVTRAELLAHFRDSAQRFETQELRELLVIEAPFEQFLPNAGAWASAAPAARAQARLQAARHIRAAFEALSERDFEDVAQEYSRGLHASRGGSWGLIGKPLQPPYDELSRRIFEFEAGQVSEPIETSAGWYIVKCGAVQAARRPSFGEAQEGLRLRLAEDKFNRALADYVLKLAEHATISSYESFIREALRRAERTAWGNSGPGAARE